MAAHPPVAQTAPAPSAGIPPILWPCGAILVGCALGPTRHAAWPILLGLGLAALLLATLVRTVGGWIIAATLLALAAALWRVAPPTERAIVWPTNSVNAVRGTVQAWPTSHGESVQAPIAVFAARTDRGWQPADVNLRATLPNYPALRRGDVVVIGGIATIRRGWWRDADGSLFGQWMRIEQMSGETTADDLRHRIAARFVTGIERHVRSPEAELTVGMLLGEKTVLDDATRAALNATGTTQHVVISGWNIAIVIGLFAVIGRRWRTRGRWAWVGVSLAAVVLYTFLVGAEASVVRAAIMGAGGLLAPLVGRRNDPLVWLGIASAAMALRDPSVVGDLSFLLSCAATFGVLAVAPWLAHQAMRMPYCRATPRLTEAAAVAVAASLMTEPIILHAFGRISLIGPAVNVIVEPLVPIIMALGFVTALASFIPVPLIATVAGTCTALPAWLFLAIVKTAGTLPGTAPYLPQPGLFLTILMYAIPAAVTGWRYVAHPFVNLKLSASAKREMRDPLIGFAITLVLILAVFIRLG